MILILAEKPSVAQAIAKVVGAVQKTQDGYLSGGGYIVANFFGHLIKLADPTEYDGRYEKWSFEDLPIFPQSFKYQPISDKEKALKDLAKLMNSPQIDSLICATDAGREGEVIFRYVYDYIGCRKPYKRLWISSLTDESISKGMANLVDGKENLFKAGSARAKVDWIVGMNLSRLYSLHFQSKTTIGRVQTATLNMIVQRDSEIANFKKRSFFKLLLANGAEWFNEDSDCFKTKDEAGKIRSLCEGKNAVTEKVEKKRKSENRPLLFSLTGLQSAANEQLGFSASKTLEITQKLYEKRLLTYPRTQSSFLTEDMKSEVSIIIERLRFFDWERVEHFRNVDLNLDKRVFDDEKVGDHHAIIPTKEIDKAQKTELSNDEKAVLSLVIKRFFLAFEQPYIFDEYFYVFDVCGNKFRLAFKEPVSLGWRKYVPLSAEKRKNQIYQKNDTFIAQKLEVKSCETAPPRAFTDGTLLSAMENAANRVEDMELRKYIRENGLGTTATRAAIIEKIIELDYVKRDRKKLVSTEKGRYLIAHLPEEIKNAELTAEMESELSAVENGEEEPEKVIESAKGLVRKIIEIENGKQHENIQEVSRVSLGKCPKCGGNVYEGKKGFYCENFKAEKRCGFYLWKDDIFFKTRKKILTANVVRSVLEKGKVLLTKCFSEKTGKYYDAYVGLKNYIGKNGEEKVGFEILEFKNKKG